jgi:hypothetical protein
MQGQSIDLGPGDRWDYARCDLSSRAKRHTQRTSSCSPDDHSPAVDGENTPNSKIAHCVAERAKLRETLQTALDDKDNDRGTPDQIRARWREADKALAASTKVMDPTHRPIYCDEAAQWAEEYVLGD